MRDTIFILMLAVALMISGCNIDAGTNDGGNNAENSTEISDNITVQKVEIYHFHAALQCYSCKTMGAYAEETVNLFFSEQKKSGQIVFDHINIELPENAELVKKYGVAGSSLWIGVYDSSGGFYKEENVDVWYMIDDKDGYLLYLKLIINKRLEGDYS